MILVVLPTADDVVSKKQSERVLGTWVPWIEYGWWGQPQFCSRFESITVYMPGSADLEYAEDYLAHLKCRIEEGGSLDVVTDHRY